MGDQQERFLSGSRGRQYMTCSQPHLYSVVVTFNCRVWPHIWPDCSNTTCNTWTNIHTGPSPALAQTVSHLVQNQISISIYLLYVAPYIPPSLQGHCGTTKTGLKQQRFEISCSQKWLLVLHQVMGSEERDQDTNKKTDSPSWMKSPVCLCVHTSQISNCPAREQDVGGCLHILHGGVFTRRGLDSQKHRKD